MKSLAISFLSLIAVFLLVSCDVPSDTPTRTPPASPDMLTQMFDAQDRATVAAENAQRVAATAQRIAAQATTQAQATREYVVLQGQQTRIAQEAMERKTVFAQNVSATAQAASANQTRYADQSRATATAHAAYAVQTQVAAQYTATAITSNATATAQTINATATTQFIVVEQTRVSASATATAHAASAEETRVRAMANATRASEETQTLIAKQNWERTTESVRAVGMVVGVLLFVLGGLVLFGWVGYRVATVETTRRQREYRDARGELVLELANGDVAQPSRMPGAFLVTDPQRALPAGTIDPDTTRRAQAVSLMLAAQSDGDRANVSEALSEPEELPAGAPAIVPGAFPIYKPFEPRPLELAGAPRLSLPIGTTASGEPLWIPFQDVTHALVGGPSGMGKTNLVHSWIQALQQNNVDLALYDGKDGLEFGRYGQTPRTTVLRDDLPAFLGDALGEMQRRFALLAEDGATNIIDYNRTRDTDDRLAHRAIVIDELYDALHEDAVAQSLETLASKARAIGIHLIMATQLPDAGSVPKHLRINALLRVSFPCPSHTNSTAILGYAGAEKIEKTPGRLLVFWSGRLIEAQAFRAALPPALPRALTGGDSPSPFDDETRQMIEWAVQQGGGWFVVAQIAEALGIRSGRVVKTARRLEQQGLLSTVQKDESGQNVGRQISQKLANMIGA